LDTADFDALHGVETGKHLYQFYKSTEDYFRILTNYFSSGLQKGDTCVWLVSEKQGGVNRAFECVREKIADAEKHLFSARLQILSAEDWYLENGSFSEEKAIRNAVAMTESLRKLGCTRFRAAGDAGSIPHEQWPEVHLYEEKIQKALKDVACILLCAYPILECSIADTRSVLKNHDAVLVGRLE
jgi:hypothetical protein